MTEIHFNKLDLNLLRVFEALFEERSVTRAGARLGLSQSAVSHSLNRLRHALRDPLFRRGGDEMRPTPRALEIAPRLAQGLHQVMVALGPTRFDPAETTRRFVIASGSFTNLVLIPALSRRLRHHAPNAELRISANLARIGDDLDGGRIDLAFGAFGRLHDRFEGEEILTETMVWAVGRDHPLAGRQPSLEDLARTPHVLVSGAPDDDSIVAGMLVEGGIERRVAINDDGAFASALAQGGLQRRVAVIVSDALSAMAMLRGTDLAAYVPRRQAAAMAEQFGLSFFDPPYRVPEARIGMVWHRQHGDHAAGLWLRDLVRAIAAEIEAAQGATPLTPPASWAKINSIET